MTDALLSRRAAAVSEPLSEENQTTANAIINASVAFATSDIANKGWCGALASSVRAGDGCGSGA